MSGAVRRRALGLLGWSLLAVVAAAFVWVNRHDVPAAIRQLLRADRRWVTAAAVVALVSFANHTAQFAAGLRAADAPLPIRQLGRAAASAFFLNTITKSNGLAGLLSFLRAGRRTGGSRQRITAGYLLVTLLGHLALVLVVVVAMGLLVADGRVTGVELVALAGFVIYTVAQAAILIAVVGRRRWLDRLFAVVGSVRARLRPERAPRAAGSGAEDLREAIKTVRSRPRAVVVTGLLSLAVDGLNIVLLVCALRAVGFHGSVTVAFTAYAVSVLFMVVSFLPGGLGVVEAGMAATLVASGVTAATAAAAVVIYRLFELWVPGLVGAACTGSALRGGGDAA